MSRSCKRGSLQRGEMFRDCLHLRQRRRRESRKQREEVDGDGDRDEGRRGMRERERHVPGERHNDECLLTYPAIIRGANPGRYHEDRAMN